MQNRCVTQTPDTGFIQKLYSVTKRVNKKEQGRVKILACFRKFINKRSLCPYTS